MTCHLRSTLLVAFACAAMATPVAAAPVQIQGISGELDSSYAKGKFFDTLGEDCINSQGIAWHGLGRRSDPKFKVTLGHSTSAAAKGSYDGVARRGEVHEVGTIGIQLSRFVGKRTERELNLSELGIEIAGGRVYFTARLVSATTHLSAAGRTRIAVIAHPKFLAGPATVPRHPTEHVPDTFLFAVQGAAAVTPQFSKAIERLRCKGKVGVLHPHRLRPGSRFGFLTVQLQPAGAFGTAGSVVLRTPEIFTDDGTQLGTAPVAPATAGTVKHARGFVFALPPGVRVPLDCSFGLDCAPASGAQIAPAGGFTLTTGGRSVTVDGLSLSYAKGNGQVDRTLTGSVNGQPLTIVRGPGASGTPEFNDAVGAALGVHITDSTLDLLETFTDTAPL